MHLSPVLQEIGGQSFVREMIRRGREQLPFEIVLRVCSDGLLVRLACAVSPREDSTVGRLGVALGGRKATLESCGDEARVTIHVVPDGKDGYATVCDAQQVRELGAREDVRHLCDAIA